LHALQASSTELLEKYMEQQQADHGEHSDSLTGLALMHSCLRVVLDASYHLYLEVPEFQYVTILMNTSTSTSSPLYMHAKSRPQSLQLHMGCEHMLPCGCSGPLPGRVCLRVLGGSVWKSVGSMSLMICLCWRVVTQVSMAYSWPGANTFMIWMMVWLRMVISWHLWAVSA
jgi:hypothetical protein